MTHLSPYRAVIADCFDFRPALRALELGAGAGALTRWLGERYDEVVAVERDGRLARVAALRTRDLAGVRVHEADPATVESGGGFDLVVVAPGLGEPIDLAALVARAAAALATDGVLLLAVPNRLAFKYWSGAREERSGAPYVALHGHPGSPATTHSARALEEALAAAGFAGADWYLPYPDHLVTRTVVNAGRATPEHGLHNWIETPFADRLAERPAVPLVEGLALREVARAGLLREYANAFLVLAWTGERDAALRHVGADDGWIAKHYSADRAAAFGKRATLTEDGGDLVVANTPLQPGAERVGDAALEHRFTREPFRRGELASLRVLEMIADGTFEGRFGLLLEELHAHLVDRHGLGRTDAEGVPLLRGDAIDVALWNVVSGEDGTWETIDGEWAFAGPLPADFVLFRGLLYLAGRVAPYLGHKPIYRDPNAFAVRWTRHLYPRFSEGRFRAFHQVEAWFQVAAGALPAARTALLLSGWPNGRPHEVDALLAAAEAPRAFTTVAFAEELVAQPALLESYLRTLRAGDPATLAIYAPGWDESELVARVMPLIAATGIAEDALPDLMALPVPAGADADERVAAGSDAVLTTAAPAGAFAALPWVPADRVAELRARALGEDADETRAAA